MAPVRAASWLPHTGMGSVGGLSSLSQGPHAPGPSASARPHTLPLPDPQHLPNLQVPLRGPFLRDPGSEPSGLGWDSLLCAPTAPHRTTDGARLPWSPAGPKVTSGTTPSVHPPGPSRGLAHGCPSVAEDQMISLGWWWGSGSLRGKDGRGLGELVLCGKPVLLGRGTGGNKNKTSSSPSHSALAQMRLAEG